MPAQPLRTARISNSVAASFSGIRIVGVVFCPGERRVALSINIPRNEKGEEAMSKLKSLSAALFLLAVLVYVAAPAVAKAQGPHGPRYLVALSDLRTARDYIESDHR